MWRWSMAMTKATKKKKIISIPCADVTDVGKENINGSQRGAVKGHVQDEQEKEVHAKAAGLGKGRLKKLLINLPKVFCHYIPAAV